MDFAAREIEGLPSLAWLVALPNGSGKPLLLHGRMVERFGNGFFEGAWDGPFADTGFSSAANVFGSGALFSAAGTIFVPASHTLEPLYIASTDRLQAVSNSLVFLLHYCGLRFDPKHAGYGRRFSAIGRGLDGTPQKIQLDGGTVTLVYHHNVVIRPHGNLELAPKPLPPSFPCFDDYVSYMRGVTARVFQNADDPKRKCRYRPIATLTSGYDSGAAAVIAKSCGCNESVGLATSNKGHPDSGKAAANLLGLKHSEHTGLTHATGSYLAEAEFLAPGMQGEDLFFNALVEKLPRRIVTTGIYGGVIWEKGHTPSTSLRTIGLSGCSLGEFRLRNNFLHLPVPYIGGQRWPDVHRISNGLEMAAYCLGGGYDRPVPRRILEEAGVPRATVGQAKRAASLLLFQGRDRMSPAAHASIYAYCKREGLYLQYFLAFYPKTLWWTAGRTLYGSLRRLGRLLKEGRLRYALARMRNRICALLFNIEAPIFGAGHPRFAILLTWAISEIDGRYAVAGRHAPQSEFAPARAAYE